MATDISRGKVSAWMMYDRTYLKPTKAIGDNKDAVGSTAE